MQGQVKDSYIIAIDAGGTMTDAVIIRSDGTFHIGKYRTYRIDESESYMGAVKAVADKIGVSTEEIHKNCDVAIYAGTAMTNTLITMDGLKVGLITTRGMEHMSIIENGLTYIGQSQKEILHQQLRRHTAPLVKKENIIGVTERVTGGSYFGDVHLPAGTVLVPLNEKEVEDAAEELIKNDVEVIGIMFLNSHVFPDHEIRAAEIVKKVIEKHGKDIKVVASHEIAPVGKDCFRLKSLLVQCFAAEKARKQLEYVENAARKDGYDKQLLTLLSFGGAVSIKYPRLYETIVSGPIGGLTASKEIATLLDISHLAVGDVGGTSFDVGLVVDKRIELRPDSDFAKHRLVLPMVELNSAPLGMGTEVKVNDLGNLEIGPESAGWRVGVCLDHDRLTITDIHVALGYIAEDSFLGGKIILDRDKACKELERVGKFIGIPDLYQAGEGILELFFTNLREFARTQIEAKGFNLKQFVFLACGGGGETCVHGIAKGKAFKEIITTPFASVFSAYGVGCSDIVHRYNKGIVGIIRHGISVNEKSQLVHELITEWKSLEEKAFEEFMLEGVRKEDVKILRGVFMRYIGQLESFETKLDFEVVRADDLDRIIRAFEKMYEIKYPSAAKFPEAGYALTQVFIEAVAPKVKPVLPECELASKTPPDSAYAGTRRVYYRGKWTDFKLFRIEEIKAGNEITGPAILFDDISTLVIGADDVVNFDKYRIIHFN
ncbi:hydantoinase/oxoprolinase family protein [Desulfofundulus thermosubterraneus]|uniref:Acetone carboxylase, beta subunit n=1 Tax=Desulfofundulus thermosubterraneus DSM 16057 TaxID=1121432 RepID=A0A1M6IND8_9FIRM|nr:hydantoinase/oxoprolinase family protein [Desulfofundulus thermosubterraneus]SHJ35893.1 acetone carboxylase, beta subunit [Desulfofundulus thermosubterraneus DSM 16057]